VQGTRHNPGADQCRAGARPTGGCCPPGAGARWFAARPCHRLRKPPTAGLQHLFSPPPTPAKNLFCLRLHRAARSRGHADRGGLALSAAVSHQRVTTNSSAAPGCSDPARLQQEPDQGSVGGPGASGRILPRAGLGGEAAGSRSRHGGQMPGAGGRCWVQGGDATQDSTPQPSPGCCSPSGAGGTGGDPCAEGGQRDPGGEAETSVSSHDGAGCHCQCGTSQELVVTELSWPPPHPRLRQAPGRRSQQQHPYPSTMPGAARTTRAPCSFPSLIRNILQTTNLYPEPDTLEKGTCVP